MTSPELQVEVRDSEIVVTIPGTAYRDVYFMRDNQSQLVAKSLSLRERRDATFTQSEFHAQAWIAANDKAREMGWIA